NATTVLLACLVWQLIWGMAGLFLAMPLMAALKAVCMQVEGWQRWGDLMSSGPAKPLQLDAVDQTRLGFADDSLNGEKTLVADDIPDSGKGGRPTGDSKRDRF